MDIENIQITVRSNSQAAVVGIDDMVSALQRLKTGATGGVRGLSTTANQLKKFAEAVRSVNVDTGKFAAIAEAMKGLSGIEKASGFSSTINSLKKLPDIINQLDSANLEKFAQQMERVANAVRPLATEMQKVSDGFKAFPIRIKKLIESNAGLAASNAKTGKSFKSLLGNILNIAAIRKVGQVIGDLMKKSSEYTETLNLFNVALGQYADEAFEYANKVASVMGIDPAEWMRGQGVFMTLATGFGIAGDKAAYMSKNLTQLGYDLSSYYNISAADAIQKLQSGISGELEPLRRLGYDLSQAKLEATALALGIDKSVSSMNQAEKGMLRYYAIMTQVTQVQGDMARTLESPANQLRILQSAANQAARALGNIFVGALGRLIPYAIAFLNVITSVLNALGSLFGFKVKGVDTAFGNAAGGAEDINESLGGGASSAKKMRDYLMGIDELNVIPDNSGGGGGGGGGGGADMFDFELPGYEFIGESSEIIKQIEEGFKNLLKWVEPLLEDIIWLGMSIWDFAEGVANVVVNSSAIEALKTGLTKLRDALGVIVEYISDIWRSDLVQALVGNTLVGGISMAGTALSLLADALEVVVALLRGDIGTAIEGVAKAIIDIFVLLIKTLMNIFNTINIVIRTISSSISRWFANIFDSIGFDSWAKKLRENAEEIEKEMEGKNYEFQVGIEILDEESESVKSTIEGWFDPIASSAGEATSGLAAFREEFSLFPETVEETETIAETVSTSITDASLVAQETAKQMGTDVATAYSTSIQESMSTQAETVMKSTANALTDNAHFLNTAMIEAGADGAFEFGNDYGHELMRGVETALANTATAAVNTFKRYVSDMITELTPIKTEFSNIVQAAKNMARDVNTAISSIKGKDVNVNIKHNASSAVSEINRQLDKIGENLSVTVKITVMADGGTIKNFAKGGIIPAAAMGGGFNRGQLFIAREAGPELVAGIGGGRTAVMNNNQIVESVSNGVYRAVVDAMGSQPTDTGDVVLVLGDKEVYRASKRGEKASGYSLVANPSFA